MEYGLRTVAHTASRWRHTCLACQRTVDGRCSCICGSERRADVVAAILKVGRHIKDPTRSIRLFEEQSQQMSSRSHLKRRNLNWAYRLNKKSNKINSDIGSIPDPNK